MPRYTDKIHVNTLSAKRKKKPISDDLGIRSSLLFRAKTTKKNGQKVLHPPAKHASKAKKRRFFLVASSISEGVRWMEASRSFADRTKHDLINR